MSNPNIFLPASGNPNFTGDFVRSDSETFIRVGYEIGQWIIEDHRDDSPPTDAEHWFYNSVDNVSLVAHTDDPLGSDKHDWKFVRGNWANFISLPVDTVIDSDMINPLPGEPGDPNITDLDVKFNSDSDLTGITIPITGNAGGGTLNVSSPTLFRTQSLRVVRKLFVNDEGVVRRLRKLWVVHDNAPRLIFLDSEAF